MKANPIYAKAKAIHDAKGGVVHIGLVEAAKLIRANLKREFPDVKFSVRSSRYSGGSSIDVRWVDGPYGVDHIIRPFAGKGFDGMIDMAYYQGAWLMPDGSASFRENGSGTQDSMGSVAADDADAPDDGAVPVSFGAGYVSGQRGLSQAQVAKDLQRYADHWNDELAEAISDGRVAPAGEDGYAYAAGASNIRVGHEWGDNALWRFLADEAREAREMKEAA